MNNEKKLYFMIVGTFVLTVGLVIKTAKTDILLNQLLRK